DHAAKATSLGTQPTRKSREVKPDIPPTSPPPMPTAVSASDTPP
ncbi:hypothetical protein A2U01_0028684, partial [Trifolium medium]|nr:hypothetical protein [Trifolium medium]